MKTAAFSAAELRFWGWIPPGPGFVGLLRERARRSPVRGFQRLQPPLGRLPSSRARWSSLGFGAAWPAQTTFFLISRVKPVFTKRRRLGDEKSLFVSRFVACFFAGPERNWRCRRGKSPPPRNPGRPETPAAPRRPAQRPRPAPGFCAASANARPGDPAPVRLLEKALWVPSTTEPFRKAPSGKPERERKTKGGSLNATPTPGTPTHGLARPLRPKMAGRAPSRNAPSVAESPQNQHRRSAP